MAELSVTRTPPRAELLRLLRPRLAEVASGLRVSAESLLGAESRIDFVGVEPPGRVVLVLVGDEGQDLELVARALAQRAWVEARLGDWLQLAPQLGIRDDAGVRVVLLCSAFGPESLAAARALGTAAPTLVRYRSVRNGAGVETLLETLWRPESPLQPAVDEGPAPVFRTGLTDADLEEARGPGPAADSPRPFQAPRGGSLGEISGPG